MQVSVSVMLGDAGGLLRNVNRWRGLVGQPPVEPDALDEYAVVVDAAQLEAVLTQVEAGDRTAMLAAFGADARLVDVTGQSRRTFKPERLVGLVIYREETNLTWFYKLQGEPISTDAALVDFLQFASEYE